jgi:glycerophosphoryl diester phosphodiesterase
MTEKRFYIVVLFMFLFAVSCSGQVNVVTTIVANNSIVAHRGAWKKNNFPQNSIASLKEAIRLNCKGSEFDIVLTADDSLIVCHGPSYNNLNIQQSKYSDLVTLKFSNGEKLPTLREYIMVASKNNTTTQLFCELKNYELSAARKKVFITKSLALVNQLKAQQLMVYSSFDYDLLKQVRALNTVANVQYLGGDISPEQLKLDNITGACYNFSIYEAHPEWIDKAKKNSITLNVWTVNDVNRINFYLKNNFESIVTDEPELALSYQTLSINDFTISKLEFKVFPNPASSIISLQSESLLTSDLKTEIIDEVGKIVMTKTFNHGSSAYSIETDCLYSGVYFLKMTNQEASKTIKVIIKK